MPVTIELKDDELLVTDLISVQALDRSFFGSSYQNSKTTLKLLAEEALYLIDVRNSACNFEGKPTTFNFIAGKFQGPKFLARYFCYRDWRDRGIIARAIEEAKGPYNSQTQVKYPTKQFKSPKVKSRGLFFYDDLMCIIDNNEEGLILYDKYWFGQFGTYKANKHGQFLKLDAYETLFLSKFGNLKITLPEEMSKAQLNRESKYQSLEAELEKKGQKLDNEQKRLVYELVKRRSDFLSLYEVYEDLRLKGFVLKTGFKFGTHFRLYMPGALPNLSNEEWMHSKHVIHVFPRASKLLISEWARAIRVAHGVRKTFILAIPGKKDIKTNGKLDFLLYHRKKEGIQTPKADNAKYAMLCFSEEEEIGGGQLAQAIANSGELGLDLILSICDRESSVTHYLVKRINLSNGSFEYYEIEWVQP